MARVEREPKKRDKHVGGETLGNWPVKRKGRERKQQAVFRSLGSECGIQHNICKKTAE